jgi:hypothetical protein
MSQQAVFVLSILLSFIVWGIVGARYIWPALWNRPRAEALLPGLLGAAYFIPILPVPLLVITHVFVFRILLREEAAITTKRLRQVS